MAWGSMLNESSTTNITMVLPPTPLLALYANDTVQTNATNLLLYKAKKDHSKDIAMSHFGHNHTVAEATRDAGYLFSVMIVTILVSQAGLVYWKNHYARSFFAFTLAGLWLIPPLMCAHLFYVRFVCIWAAFTAYTGYVLLLASRKPIARSTPRIVFIWFKRVYVFCYALALAGYGLIMTDFFALSMFFPKFLNPATPVAIMWLFYGLYFGVLGRDCANFITETMATKIGYYSKGMCAYRHDNVGQP